MNSPINVIFNDTLLAERQRYAVRITLMRVILVGLFLANVMFFHLIVRTHSWHTGMSIFTIYFICALLLWYSARCSKPIAWYSGLAIPFLDVPMVVLMNLPAFSSSASDLGVAGIYILSAVMALLVAITTLTLQIWQIVLTGLVGVIAIVFLAYAYEASGQTLVFCILLVLSMVTVCLFLRENMITLVCRASEKIYLQRHIDDIAALQQSLLPDHLPEIPGVKFAVSYEPSESAGGDYYGFRELDDGRIGMMIADVSGHGPSAAVVMAMLRTALSAFRLINRPVESIVSDLNRLLNSNLKDGTFVTAIFIAFDTKSGKVQLANAGHCHPLIQRNDGTIERLVLNGGPPLGVLPDIPVFISEISMHQGDSLILYTDGLIEAFNPDGEQFGIEGIEQAVSKSVNGVEETLNMIKVAVNQHRYDRASIDDQTVLIMHYEIIT